MDPNQLALFAEAAQALPEVESAEAEDVPVQVEVPGKKRKSHRAFLWTYVGDSDHPYTVYDFTWTRSREGPESFLRYADEERCYRGYLRADAYSGYDRLYASRLIVEVGCWATKPCAASKNSTPSKLGPNRPVTMRQHGKHDVNKKPSPCSTIFMHGSKKPTPLCCPRAPSVRPVPTRSDYGPP